MHVSPRQTKQDVEGGKFCSLRAAGEARMTAVISRRRLKTNRIQRDTHK